MEKTFADILKHIIKFSNIKLSALADFIGYDVSYLSKWCSGINRPSSRYVVRINRRIAEFVADELCSQDNIYPFFHEFNIKLKKMTAEDSKKHLSAEINNLLNDAYYQEQQQLGDSEIGSNDTPFYETIVGRTNIKRFFKTKITAALSNMQNNIDILITGDIITFLAKNDISTFLEKCNFSSEQVNIHIGCNEKKLSEASSELIGKLYALLNKCIDINFYIYDDKNFAFSNIITVKNCFSLQYSIHKDSMLDICTYISDEKINCEIWERTREKFEEKNCMMELKNDVELIKFRSFFYLNKKLLLFCAKGFEFFLPAQAFQKLLKLSHEYQYSPALQQTIQNMQITWEEQFDSTYIDFFLPESNIVRYIGTGQLTYGEIDYTSTPDEREQQLLQLIKCMQKNPSINVYLIGESQAQIEENYFRLSYYSNNKTAYLKKNKDFLRKDAKTIYLLKNHILVDKFNTFFQDLRNKENCCKFSADDIAALYKKNSPLLYRIWQKKIPAR